MSSSEIEDRAVPASVYGAIFLCSLAVLMQEILLTRIFSFTIWYHLAYLTISTVLLGFGAAGSILTRFPRLWQSDPRRVAGGCAAAAGIALEPIRLPNRVAIGICRGVEGSCSRFARGASMADRHWSKFHQIPEAFGDGSIW